MPDDPDNHSLRENIERAIELGVSMDRDEAAGNPEFQGLLGYFARLEEERRRNRPEVICKEITDALNEAVHAEIPPGIPRGHISVCAQGQDIVSMRWTWVVVVDEFSYYDIPKPSDDLPLTPAALTVTTIRVPRFAQGLVVNDLREWREKVHGVKVGELKIREWIRLVARAIGSHIRAASVAAL